MHAAVHRVPICLQRQTIGRPGILHSFRFFSSSSSSSPRSVFSRNKNTTVVTTSTAILACGVQYHQQQRQQPFSVVAADSASDIATAISSIGLGTTSSSSASDGTKKTTTHNRNPFLSSTSSSSSSSNSSSSSSSSSDGDENSNNSLYDFDLVVIGGGSGGLACAREAASLHAKVALLDFVTPSPHGTKWGIGGTCVNVGCIPKKLMHTAALLGEGLHDAEEYGWGLKGRGEGSGSSSSSSSSIVKNAKHSWQVMTENIHGYIKGTNWGYKNALRDEKIEFVNALGKIVDPHTVEYRLKGNKASGGKEIVKRIRAAHIVIAVGGRPRYPDGVKGAKEYGITSDDLFWLPESPGKTLLVGAGYVALECAGFLRGIGHEAVVMARGQILRGFDTEMAEKIANHMQNTGTRFVRDATPLSLEEVVEEKQKNANADSDMAMTTTKKKIKVTWKTSNSDSLSSSLSSSPTLQSEVFDTVVFATGRYPLTEQLGLENVGVRVEKGSGKIYGGGGRVESSSTTPTQSATAGSALQSRDVTPSIWSETTNVPSIHAVGDVLVGGPELTPVAIRAGKLLARRILSGIIPTTNTASPDTTVANNNNIIDNNNTTNDKTVDSLTQQQQHKQRQHHPLTLSTMMMDYSTVATTIFTPMEYGCVGLSEEEAIQQFGVDGIEVYHLAYDTLELAVAHRLDATTGMPLPPQCFTKVITLRGSNGDGGGTAVDVNHTTHTSRALEKQQQHQQKVLGIHVLGPHAGEVIQGFSTALKVGITKGDLDATIGIHPTHAEEVVTLDRTKRSGEPAVKTSC